MVKKIKIGKVQINFSNKWFYTFIAIGILVIIGVGVYATVDKTKAWHSLDEIELPDCADGQVLQMSGGSWGCVDLPNVDTGLKTKVVEIGGWDMTANITVKIAHGLSDFRKIRTVNALIRNDGDSWYYMLNRFGNQPDPILLQGGIHFIDDTTIHLRRRTGGQFDGSEHDSVSYNRGWIYIVYEA